jgi:hypothetical protein
MRLPQPETGKHDSTRVPRSIIKLRARGPDVVEQSIIDATIQGMNLGPCGEYLERCPLKTISKLFEIMQEYCKSDRGKR